MTTETHSPDPEVEAAFRWLLSYLPTGGWESRRAAVERHIEAMVTPRAAPPPDAKVSKVGRIRALRIHAGLALDAGKSLFEVCDAHSHELHHLYSLLYDHQDGLKEELVDRFDSAESDVLVLDYIILNPKWRRLKLGLAVSLIAPLLPRAHKLLRVPVKWLPRNRTKEQKQAARIKLRGYFRRLGFRRLGRTPYFALSLHQIAPDSRELLGREPE